MGRELRNCGWVVPERSVHTDGSAEALQHAIVRFSVESFRQMDVWKRVRFADEGDVAWVASDVPLGDLNAIIHSQMSAGEVDSKLDRIMGAAQAENRCVRAYALPISTPSDYPDRLLARGLEEQETSTTMIFEHTAEPIEVGDYAVEEATDAAGIRRWSTALMEGFGMPSFMIDIWADMHLSLGFGPGLDWRHLMLVDEGKPVATVTVNVAAGIAGVSAIAVAPTHRGKGLSSVITRVALRACQEAGVRFTNLLAVPGAAGVYERVGFRSLCPCRVFERDAPQSPAEPPSGSSPGPAPDPSG